MIFFYNNKNEDFNQNDGTPLYFADDKQINIKNSLISKTTHSNFLLDKPIKPDNINEENIMDVYNTLVDDKRKFNVDNVVTFDNHISYAIPEIKRTDNSWKPVEPSPMYYN